MKPRNWNQIGKLLLSFATFCFVYPHALQDFGKEEPKEVAEAEVKPLPAR